MKCPRCGTKLQFDDAKAGTKVHCTICTVEIDLGAPSSPAATTSQVKPRGHRLRIPGMPKPMSTPVYEQYEHFEQPVDETSDRQADASFAPTEEGSANKQTYAPFEPPVKKLPSLPRPPRPKTVTPRPLRPEPIRPKAQPSTPARPGPVTQPRPRPPTPVRPRPMSPPRPEAVVTDTFDLDRGDDLAEGLMAEVTNPQMQERTLQVIRPSIWAHPWSTGAVVVMAVIVLLLFSGLGRLGGGGIFLLVFLLAIGGVIVGVRLNALENQRLVLTTHRMIYSDGPKERRRRREIRHTDVTMIHAEHYHGKNGELDSGHLIIVAGAVKVKVGPVKRLRHLHVTVEGVVKRAQARADAGENREPARGTTPRSL